MQGFILSYVSFIADAMTEKFYSWENQVREFCSQFGILKLSEFRRKTIKILPIHKKLNKLFFKN